MRLPVAVLAVLLSAWPLFAQPAFPGEPFPLTHARYAGTRGANPLLLSNGREPVLFWSDGTHVRVTRMVAGEPPSPGRALFPASDLDTFDAVWTGKHFLVVGTQFPLFGIGKIAGARIAANGARCPQRVSRARVERGRDRRVLGGVGGKSAAACREVTATSSARTSRRRTVPRSCRRRARSR